VAAIGIVVPAWNEAESLPRLLASLLAQADVTIDAVVAPNGCLDDTAAAALAFVDRFAARGHRLRVIPLAVASKPAALQAGDEALQGFPRAYIDADVVLSPTALRDVAATLETPEPRVAAPRIRFAAPADTAGLAAFVETLPPFADDVVGGGFYAVNPAGRARWGAFPDLVADDAFVLGRFAPAERRVVATAEFRCRFPGRDRLPDVLARWELGRLQLDRAGLAAPGGGGWRALRAILARPGRWPLAGRWLALKRAARASARRRLADGDLHWSRAEDVTPS
jgi:glycosyltransferase involved in cell wall biosynthesis